MVNKEPIHAFLMETISETKSKSENEIKLISGNNGNNKKYTVSDIVSTCK